MTESVEVHGLEVTIRRSERRRTIGLSVEQDGLIVATVPRDAPIRSVEALLEAKAGWVSEKLRLVESRPNAASPKQFVPGEGFPYLGRDYRLQLVEKQEEPLRLESGRWKLLREAVPHGRDHFENWYRNAAYEWVEERINRFANRVPARPSTFEVRALGYRWGSCGQDGRLHFHWALMQLPRALAEYVVVHELIHLSHPSHDESFWREFKRIIPDAEERRAVLAAEGHRWLW